MKPVLCYIAIIAEAEILVEVRSFQQHAAAYFNSSRALRSPPHITLEPPFKWCEDDFPNLENELALFAESRTPFSIRFAGFGKFASRVIFVDIEPDQKLLTLQGALKARLRSSLHLVSERQDRPFRAHMTVAFKDLKKNQFVEAWEYFSKIQYEKQMPVDRFTLLQHDGHVWQPRIEFNFGR